MRLVTCRYGGRVRVGRIDDVAVTLLPREAGASMLDVIDRGPEYWARVTRLAGETVPLTGVEFCAPIPRPRKNVMAIGWNYRAHAHESAAAHGSAASVPEAPVVFTKNVTSVTGPHDDIPLDTEVTTQFDWEIELGVVIGIGGRKIPERDALAHVFGYTVINDLSARDIQFRHKQFFLGKSLDGACPMGPAIVTADAIHDPQNLDLALHVNGVLKQSANTRDQIFPVAVLIATLSRGMRLEPGDVIATGTPAGVGYARTPPEFLHAGDVVECEITGIGQLRNRIVASR